VDIAPPTSGTRGCFITLEGPEGCGKTTQARLLAQWLESQSFPVLLTREPGGTPIGEQIRTVLHDCANRAMTAETEILLYSAARAQHVAEVIQPALQAGTIVICDRFYDSTYAYQGYGRGLPMDTLRMITAFATRGLTPDLTLYLDVPPELGLQRRAQSGETLNRLDREALAFHRRVRAGYQALMREEPARWRLVDATAPIDVVQEQLQGLVLGILRELGINPRGR